MVKEMQHGTYGSGNSSLDCYKGSLKWGFPYTFLFMQAIFISNVS